MNINCKGPQKKMPQNIGSIEDLFSKNIPSGHMENSAMLTVLR